MSDILPYMEKPKIEKFETNEGESESLKRKASRALLTLFAGITIGYSLDEMSNHSENKGDTVVPIESKNTVFDTARDELLRIVKESDPHLKESYKKAFESFDHVTSWIAYKKALVNAHYASPEELNSKDWHIQNVNNVVNEIGRAEYIQMIREISGDNDFSTQTAKHEDQFSGRSDMENIDWIK